MLSELESIVGISEIDHLVKLSRFLQGKKIVHINSTKIGGGVAELLTNILPLKHELGLDATWEIVVGQSDFYKCTKMFHNLLQGVKNQIVPDTLLKVYEQTNEENAQRLYDLLNEADFVFIHDPQPAALIKFFPNRKGKWIWRCHIDISRPNRQVWKFLKQFVIHYDASIFSLVDFARSLPHPQYIIAPSINPLSDKNKDLNKEDIEKVYTEFNIDPSRPVLLQVSRFDRFKDPIGVISAYKLVKKSIPSIQLILAGGSADDDPEGSIVLEETLTAANSDKDIHVLSLPPDANITINALQRAADIVIQKSTKEGFGLTVTESLWKSKPVIGGNTGGIRLQVIDNYNGFLVNTPEGAALRIKQLLSDDDLFKRLKRKGREFVKDNFLITRHVREYLTLLVILQQSRATVVL
ncbi:glycosyltransferase [Desulfurella multipotens]|jgi:trehalose synthase|uniref:Trehalose synthase (ADP-glucose) n=1 Tax=Desulfurella multipotens TaxID=79269 RepID=A0A1G6KXN7_9BACT|nr:glycosyltransferase [Desulfurella multipotens]PMP69343.1 MAG: glycosyl transferase family 1 [Desulfurella multipotens]SDC35717.1 trehalose synthase (ADP-glucose) [Desulfurella multipotens]